MSQIPRQNFANAPFLDHFPRWIGGGIALFGLLVMVAWQTHWQTILQMIPGTAPMQFNTAFCFVLSGAALFLLTTSWAKVVPWMGGAVALLTTLTLLEYLTGRDLYVDLIFFKPYFEADTVYSGRMAPLTATTLIFIGVGLVLACSNQRWPHRLAGTGLLACIVGVIAFVALFGYAFGIGSAYGWGAYSRMAVNTAGALLVLSSGLLSWAWQTARRENYNFLRWVPVTASMTLMLMAAFVSAVNMTELKSATYWRKHTVEVIVTVQTYLENLLDIQRGARGYVTTGDTNALASYESSLKLEPSQFGQLVELTRDNSSQQRRLKKLSAATGDVFAYDRRIVAVYNEEGYEAVSKLDETGRGRVAFGHARDLLKEFSQEEQRLLNIRGASEEADYHNAALLLVDGCVLAAALVLIGNLMASREMKLRRIAESRLTETLTLQKAILNSANYAIVSIDGNGLVKTFNPAAERMLGYATEEVVGKTTPLLWRDPQEVATRAKELSHELGRSFASEMEALLAKVKMGKMDETEAIFVHKDGHRFPVLVSLTPLANESGAVSGFLGVIGDISERKHREAERETMIADLQRALAEVKTLSGLVPICGWCKNLRSDKGYWQSVDVYLRSSTSVTFTHGVCPDCAAKLEADLLKGSDR